MPCDCGPVPEMPITERVAALDREHKRLLQHHKEVVAERDELRAKVKRLLERLGEEALAERV